MKKPKVMTVLGTRPEIIRLSRVLAVLDRNVEHILVHTGQNFDYELNEIFFRELEIRKPDYFLEAAAGSPAATIGRIVAGIDPVLAREHPDAFLVLGDTNSALSAIPAKRRKIPVFHMEAGNRCFDDRVPEEVNRRIVDHVSDLNLPYSGIAREHLLREGFPPERIIKTGSPMYEVLSHYRKGIEGSDILERLELRAGDYYVVSAHREENVDSEANLAALVRLLIRLASGRKKRVIVTTHPRTRKRLEESGAELPPAVELLQPLGFFAYVKLQECAAAVLSDSGTISEESAILNFPALTIREVHERPEGMEEGAVIMTGLEWARVNQGLDVLESFRGQPRRPVADYSSPDVSRKVLYVILSYIDFVNRRVWFRART